VRRPPSPSRIPSSGPQTCIFELAVVNLEKE
jgi:hypothetical protein